MKEVNQYHPFKFQGAKDDPAVYRQLNSLTSIYEGGSVSSANERGEQILGRIQSRYLAPVPK